MALVNTSMLLLLGAVVVLLFGAVKAPRCAFQLACFGLGVALVMAILLLWTGALHW
jgi:hypothetical protein